MIKNPSCITKYNAEVIRLIESLTPIHKSYWDKTKEKLIIEAVGFIKSVIKECLDKGEGTCAYCGSPLWITSNPEIEHIAPKYKYPQWMFEPKNLVYACHLCNGPLRKGKINTVELESSDYDSCEFKIVHPYLDNYQEHYKFDLLSATELIVTGISKQGRYSVELFKLNCSYRIEDRAKRFIASNQKIDEERLIQLNAILTFKNS